MIVEVVFCVYVAFYENIGVRILWKKSFRNGLKSWKM